MFGSNTAQSITASSLRKSRLIVCTFSLGLAASLAWPTSVMAQSGTRITPQPSFQSPQAGSQARSIAPQGSQTQAMAPQGSQTQPMATQGSQTQPMATQGSSMHSSAGSGSQNRAPGSSVALGGYCPVCVISLKKWVKGSSEHQVTYDGKTYLFPDADVKQTFLNNPAKWVPAMGGDCTVCKVNMGKDVAGSVMFSSLYQDRLYLFPGETQKQEFRQNPNKYANSDVAFGGKCTVCRIDMNQEVAGNPQFATFYKGKRYLFPGAEQQAKFVANPAKYAEM